MSESTAEIPPELFARLAHPTVRLSGSIDDAAARIPRPGLPDSLSRASPKTLQLAASENAVPSHE
jgi:hypothetical protein